MSVDGNVALTGVKFDGWTLLYAARQGKVLAKNGFLERSGQKFLQSIAVGVQLLAVET